MPWADLEYLVQNIGFENLEKNIALARNKTKEEFVKIFSRANPTIPNVLKGLDSEKRSQFVSELENNFMNFKKSDAYEFPTAVWVVRAVK